MKRLSAVGGTVIFVAALLAVVIASRLPPQSSKPATGAQPIWEIDLAKFGYQGRPPITLTQDGPPWGFGTYQQGVAFTTPNVLAVFFVTHENPPGEPSENRRPLPSDPFRLVAVFLDAGRGELIKRLDWPVPAIGQNIPTPFFSATAKGGFVVGIGTTLSLYSSDFQLIAQYDAGQQAEPVASPAGDTILLHIARQTGARWVSQFSLLDTDRLSIITSWTDEPRHGLLLWGDELAWVSDQWVHVKTGGAPPRQLTVPSGCAYWSFINKEELMIPECTGSEMLSFVSTSGKRLRELDLGFEQLDGPAAVSRDGRRFAVATYRWGTSQTQDPSTLAARVLDSDSGADVLTLDVTGRYGTGPNFHTDLGDTRFGWGGLGLFPNAELLAVKSGSIVDVYRLPEAGRSPPSIAARSEQQPTLASRRSPSGASPKLVDDVLSWLPADTETVIAANGLFSYPVGNASPKSEGEEIRGRFRSLPLSLFTVDNGVLVKLLADRNVVLAVEGSRHFRSPAGLGLMPFEGCAIAVFADDISGIAHSFFKETSSAALRTEAIDGQTVAVFQAKMENDTWTTFVAFPKPNVAVAATNEEYLREVLARMQGNAGPRALPQNLPEWKHTNTAAEFWAVRHYDRAGATTDPTSPFGSRKAASRPDEKAIGLTFVFDPEKSADATVTYLSGDESILADTRQTLFPFESELGFRELHVRYRQTERGIVEGSFQLGHIESAQLFLFGLMGLLGHAVYL